MAELTETGERGARGEGRGSRSLSPAFSASLVSSPTHTSRSFLPGTPRSGSGSGSSSVSLADLFR
ncbi:hypothetical protein EYF80_058890 [Liparis tanakae]|uniref:Uncharacterized protein n=1 Tax=Liparis tanakae TaxID=230148 RepID=A0A4Z2EPT8_9TELE|nr:hypothetical protein EYF80_058890 [Liparis tanakae]